MCVQVKTARRIIEWKGSFHFFLNEIYHPPDTLFRSPCKLCTWLAPLFCFVIFQVVFDFRHIIRLPTASEISLANIYNIMTSSNGNIFRVIGLCVGNSPVTFEFPSQRPVTHSFDVFVDLRVNKRLSEQSRRRWFETPSPLLWRHYNETITTHPSLYSYGDTENSVLQLHKQFHFTTGLFSRVLSN